MLPSLDDSWPTSFATSNFIFTSAVGTFIFLYLSWPPFRFHARMTLYYLYYILAATSVIPIMLCNGRSYKNMWWCNQLQLISCWLFGLDAEVRHRENLVADGPSVIVSNHQSSLDVAGMGRIMKPRSTILVKKMLIYTGPFGFAIWLSRFVFVERSRKKEAWEVMAKVADEINREKLCVWIFPEGTRNLKGEMLPFKKGAFHLAVQAKVPVVPVVFSSYRKFFNPATHLFTRGSYIIEVLPPVATKNLTKDDVPELAEKVRESMMKVFTEISNEKKE